MNFRVPQSVILDDQGGITSAYILPNFIHSYPFLAVLPAVQAQLALFHHGETSVGIQSILLNYFPNPGDILNLQWLVEAEWYELPIDIQNTVWLQSMIHNGYYDTLVGRTRRQFLVNTANDAAYSFLVRNGRHVGVVSDDTLIKMTALYATMVFSREISTFGTQVYPHHFTLSDLSVRDILHSQVLQGSNRFVFYDNNLIRNVYVTRGFIGMISLLLIAIFMAIISIINTVVFPVLYILSVVLIMILLIQKKNIGGLLAAILKAVSLVVVGNILSMIIFAIYRSMESTFDIHLLMITLAILATVQIWLLIRIIINTNLTDAPPIFSVEALIRQQSSRRRFN